MERKEILEEAIRCVCSDREDQYGSPEDNFKTIAVLWSVYKDVEFTTTDVSMMMALLKIARIKTGTATSDSFVDLAGYAACGGEVSSKNKGALSYEHVGTVIGKTKSCESCIRRVLSTPNDCSNSYHMCMSPVVCIDLSEYRAKEDIFETETEFLYKENK